MRAAPNDATRAAIDWLLSPDAVRARGRQMLGLCEAGKLRHFAYDGSKLASTVALVLDTMRANYPTLEIPFHSRWRHFTVGGRDRWAELEKSLESASRDEIARIRFDLAVVSVLLDAGTGGAWSYRGADGATYGRSEGLAVASFEGFAGGLFSGARAAPLRADAAGLKSLSAARLADAMQVTPSNPLAGLEGRASLLRNLGSALEAHPELFGTPARIGNLFDALKRRARGDALPAPAILAALLHGLGSIWPGRERLDGVDLGDTWRHGAIRAETGEDPATGGLVPFHKLSQWLAYSLIEPLEAAGVAVVEIDRLTGLAEYRNGGLMIDAGLIVAREPALLRRALKPGDEAVVEWRALTVALLDRIAEALRMRLGLDAASLPLARVLEGGTWAAGRALARTRRADGGPPLAIESDGTVF
ncbi:MAG TPA: URC4/urg3 family protein [Alphaproteobacteria bacterium]|nr:URC4/urg3 family protein [Alphaproteobacteria bacterium]